MLIYLQSTECKTPNHKFPKLLNKWSQVPKDTMLFQIMQTTLVGPEPEAFDEFFGWCKPSTNYKPKILYCFWARKKLLDNVNTRLIAILSASVVIKPTQK